MRILDTDGIVIPRPIQLKNLPEGFHRYELSGVFPTQFSSVAYNAKGKYAGDFISKTPLPIKPKKSIALNPGDWHIDQTQNFDFEAFWGLKLSIDRQIEKATIKRDMAMGQGKGNRADRQASPPDHSDSMLF